MQSRFIFRNHLFSCPDFHTSFSALGGVAESAQRGHLRQIATAVATPEAAVFAEFAQVATAYL